MARRGVAVAFGLLASAAGCWSFGSVSGGTPGDGEAVGPQEAGSLSADGGATSDATTDQGGSSDAPSSAAPFCASQSPAPALCDDFDEEETLSLAQWTRQNVAGGSLGLTSAAFQGPYALSTQMGILTTSQYAVANLEKAFSPPGTPIKIAAAFEMNVVDWDTGPGGLEIIAYEVIFTNTNQYNQVVLNVISLGPSGVSAQITENMAQADGGITSNSYPLSIHPKTNGWTKVEMTVTIGNPNGTDNNSVTISLDGSPQLGANGQALQLPIQGGTPTVRLGLGYVQPPTTSAWTVNYDNFAANVSTP